MTLSKLPKPCKSCASLARKGTKSGPYSMGSWYKITVGREYLVQFQESAHMVAVTQLPQGKIIFLQTWSLRTFSAISVPELISGKYMGKKKTFV